MEVVDVSDFPCHNDGEEVVLLDLDKPNDPEANDEQPTDGVQDEPDQVHEVTVVVDDVPEGESRDDSVTTTTATVVETCDGVSQSEPTEVSNIVELISNTSINEISCDDSVAEADDDVSQSSEVIGSVAHHSTILEDVKNECLATSDDDVDNMLFVEESQEESMEDANNTSNENEEMNNIDVNACDIVIDEGTNELADINDKINTSMNKGSVTIETKNPDGSIVVKKDNLTVTIPQHIAGRDIATLNEDAPSRSGKRMLNPRFGVKVPYIHMTSQIVTQDEIAQELFQRFQKKYPLTRADKTDNTFSMKLTHKLANKIAPIKTSDKKYKEIFKNSKKVINAKKELSKKLRKISSQSLKTTESLESVLNNKISNFELSNDLKESTETNDSQHIVQITNTLHSLDESAADQNNMPDDKNCEKITSNEELIAILEDFETIETADTNGNEVADANTIGVADASIIQVVDTSGIIVEDTNGNNIVNQTANSIVVTDMNGERLPETPTPVVRKKMVRSTTRTKRCKPKLDPEIEKQIALKQLQEVSRPKRFDSHFSKRKAETEKKLVKNDLGSAQKRKKTTPDDVPEVKIAIDHYIKSYTDKRQSTVKVEPTSNDETISDNVNEIEPETKPNNVAKSRTMREINRLLGDEGAINMIYSLEKRRSPGNSNSMNILPSPRRMKKDLMLKTKLVKNAMLKMSVPTSSPMSANRLGRRSDVCPPSPSPEKKCTRKTSIDSQGSDHSITKTVLANESKIIRKHSSSSEASSVGGCPTHPVPTAIPISDETIKHTPVKALRVYTRKNKNSNLSSMLDQSLNDVSKGTNKNVKTKNAVGQKIKKQPVSKMSRSLAESIKQDIENSPYNEITVRRYDEVVHITLTPVTPVMKNALNISVMEELMKELNNLKDDDTCKVVLVSSAGRIFCQGLDVSPLIHDDPEHCKKAAVEISSTLKMFITCLSDFPKLLVAGVDGAAVGLGATMLVHFDLVFASDKATFETPYAQLGHIAEGAATTILGRLLVAELIMGSQRLTAGQAHYYGLVTRTLWPDRFHDELIPLVKSLARHSLQTLKTSKALLKQEIKEKLAKALESETHILVQQWTGDECQQNFQAYLSDAVDNINI